MPKRDEILKLRAEYDLLRKSLDASVDQQVVTVVRIQLQAHLLLVGASFAIIHKRQPGSTAMAKNFCLVFRVNLTLVNLPPLIALKESTLKNRRRRVAFRDAKLKDAAVSGMR